MTVRISYGSDYGSPVASKTIDFPQFISKRNPPDYVRRVLRGSSASGVVETLTVRTDCLPNLEWPFFVNGTASHATFKRNLKQWEQMAQAGEPWTIALDSADAVLTTLTNSPSAGDTSIDVADATGMVIGRSYVLRNEFDLEVVKISNISSLIITLTEALNFSYFAGDRFRSEMFWPARLIESRPVIIEQPPLWFNVVMPFMEDLNSI